MSDTSLMKEVQSWTEFRRSLPREDQLAFDALMERVLSHEGSQSTSGRVNPYEAMVMLALIELVKARMTRSS